MSQARKFTYSIAAAYDGRDAFNKLNADLKELGQIKAHEKLEEGFKETSAAIVTAKQKVRDLKAEMRASGSSAFSSSYKDATKEVLKLSSSLQKQKDLLAKSRDALRTSGVDVGNLAGQYDKLKAAANAQGTALASAGKLNIRTEQQINAELRSLQKAYRDLATSGKASLSDLARAKQSLEQKTISLNRELATTERVSKKAASGFRSMAVGAIGLGSVIGLASQSTQLAKSIWDAAIAGQQLDRSFVAIFGSSQKAKEELDFLRAAANELGLDYRTIAENYRGIAASSKNTVLEGIETRKIFLSVAEAATVLGFKSEQTEGALRAIYQMMSKGKIQAEELRGQLGERLFGAFQLVAESIGVTSGELDEMLERGEVGIDVLKGFAKVLHSEYGEAAKVAADDAQQAYNRMTTAWYDFRIALANAGFLEKATDTMRGLTEAMKDPAVQRAAMDLMSTVLFLGDSLFRVTTAVKGIWHTGAAVWSGSLSLIMQVAKGVAYLSDKMGLTEGAFEKTSEHAERALGLMEGQIKKAADSFSIAGKGLAVYGKEAEKAGSIVDKTFEQNEKTAIDTTSNIVTVTKEKLDKMKAQYQEYANEIKRLQDEILGREKSLAEELRAMSRTGMSDIGAWNDRKKEAEEYEVAARKAADAGEFDKAVKFADQAKAAYKDLNKEVKVGDAVAISSAEGLKVAMSGVESAGKLAIDILKKQQDQTNETMEALISESGFADLEKGMDEAQKKWLDNWTAMRKGAISDIEDVEDRLLKIKDKEVTVWINQKEKHSEGGLAGAGRRVLKLNQGGHLPGFGGGDKIDALLEAGEFVSDKYTTRFWGPEYFRWMKQVAKNGSRVPNTTTASPAASKMVSGSNNYTFHFPSGTSSSDKSSAKQLARMTIRELDRMNRGRS